MLCVYCLKMREVFDQQHLPVTCEQPFGVLVDSMELDLLLCSDLKMRGDSDQQHLSVTYERRFGVLWIQLRNLAFYVAQPRSSLIGEFPGNSA